MAVLKYPVATEKTLSMVDRDNIIVYVVDMEANKKQVKEEFENTFKVKVVNVNTVREPDNVKRAYVRLGKEFPASDIAKRLKLV
ncbi:MAG: 50S ribosomal protein L23 [Candidatus Marsarchaeota archaeon]|nr:50S ribosomal protein L23 [Candidatus Marsarchaeota archaeon]